MNIRLSEGEAKGETRNAGTARRARAVKGPWVRVLQQMVAEFE